MKTEGFFMFFAVLTLIVLASETNSQVVPYEIDKDYWFSDSHTIKTNSGWTFHIQELKEYNITGKVGGVKYYRQEHLPFSPADFCIAWGKVIEPPHNEWGNFTMLDRGCDHTYTSGDYRIELDSEYIDRHLANNHLIPADKKIYDKLMSIKEGDFIEIRGSLVIVTGENENGTYLEPWTSDTKGTFRECEIVLTEQVEVLEMPEEYKKKPGFLEKIKYMDTDEKRGIVSITMVAVMLFILIITIFLLKRK